MNHWCQKTTSLTIVCALNHLSCLTLCDPKNCSSPGSSVHGILQARILEWILIFFSRGSSWPRDWTHISHVSCVGRRVLYHKCHRVCLAYYYCFIIKESETSHWKRGQNRVCCGREAGDTWSFRVLSRLIDSPSSWCIPQPQSSLNLIV